MNQLKRYKKFPERVSARKISSDDVLPYNVSHDLTYAPGDYIVYWEKDGTKSIMNKEVFEENFGEVREIIPENSRVLESKENLNGN